jgi:hypothetical protein
MTGKHHRGNGKPRKTRTQKNCYFSDAPKSDDFVIGNGKKIKTMCEKGGFRKTRFGGFKIYPRKEILPICFRPIKQKSWGQTCKDCNYKEKCAHAG